MAAWLWLPVVPGRGDSQGTDRPVFWRERESGLSVAAFFVAKVVPRPERNGVQRGAVEMRELRRQWWIGGDPVVVDKLLITWLIMLIHGQLDLIFFNSLIRWSELVVDMVVN